MMQRIFKYDLKVFSARFCKTTTKLRKVHVAKLIKLKKLPFSTYWRPQMLLPLLLLLLLGVARTPLGAALTMTSHLTQLTFIGCTRLGIMIMWQPKLAELLIQDRQTHGLFTWLIGFLVMPQSMSSSLESILIDSRDTWIQFTYIRTLFWHIEGATEFLLFAQTAHKTLDIYLWKDFHEKPYINGAAGVFIETPQHAQQIPLLFDCHNRWEKHHAYDLVNIITIQRINWQTATIVHAVIDQ